MLFEDPEICPLLEFTKPQRGDAPHCIMIYNDLTLWTLNELCHKNFEKCPTYKKTIEEANKKCPTK